MKHLGLFARYGLATVKGVVGLFGAGSVIFAAHTLFLRYYANEWAGLQLMGVNGCAGEDMVANGDLIGGQTFCNKPLNFFPWIELYRHHMLAAALYYGVACVVILVIGFFLNAAQQRLAGRTPYGGSPAPPLPGDSEHLR